MNYQNKELTVAQFIEAKRLRKEAHSNKMKYQAVIKLVNMFSELKELKNDLVANALEIVTLSNAIEVRNNTIYGRGMYKVSARNKVEDFDCYLTA